MNILAMIIGYWGQNRSPHSWKPLGRILKLSGPRGGLPRLCFRVCFLCFLSVRGWGYVFDAFMLKMMQGKHQQHFWIDSKSTMDVLSIWD